MNPPLVSVIIPTFNRPDLLAKTLASVFAQEDCPDKEIIVADDGSALGVDEIRAICAARPLHYVRQENRGLPAARNLGFAYSRGKLLVFLDDDDLCPPGSLRARAEYFRRDPACTHVIGRLRRFCEPLPMQIDFLGPVEKADHHLCMGAGMVTRRAFEEAGGFDASIPRGEDVDFWLRVREAGMDLKFIPEICLYYRRHPGNWTHSPGELDKMLLTALHRKMRRHQPAQGTTP